MKALKRIRKILDLSFSLSAVDFKVKNEGAYLGIMWYLIEPLALFALLLLMRGVLGTNTIENYALYLFLGLVMFNFFRASTSSCVKAISSNSQFVKSMQVPAEAIILSKMLQATYAHVFEFIIIAFLVFLLGINPSGIILYPIAFVLLFIFSAGVAFFISTLGTFSDDFLNIWNIFLRLLWFLTPIFYIAPKKGALFWTNLVNPVSHLISLGRAFILNQPFGLSLPVICLFTALISLVIGLFVFEKFKKNFAEWI